jgi:DNA polymerase (family 10)
LIPPDLIQKRRSLGSWKTMVTKQSILGAGSNPVRPTTTSNVLNVLQGLESGEVLPFAVRILQTVELFCTRSVIAGSLRRLKPVVNDLDIVVQPTAAFGFSSWLKIIKAVRETFGAVTEAQGNKLARMYLPFYVQVDFYNAEAATWGVLLLVRTGSKEHNVKLCNLAIAKGLRLKYSLGLLNDAGHVVAGRTEEEVFTALGLAFVSPNEREA